MAELLNAPEPILQFVLKASQLYFKGKTISFTPEDLIVLKQSLPQEWWNDNDRLIYFTFYADGTYYAEREKTIYNYSVKDYVTTAYQFNVLNEKSAHTVYLLMCEFFENLRLQQLVEQKDSLRLKLMQEFDYINVSYISQRNRLLEKSDWTQLPDVALRMSENEKNMWTKYRKYLRDLTDLDSWKNKAYLDTVFPLTPKTVIEKYPEITSDEYLENENHFEYLLSITIANKVEAFLKSILLEVSMEYDEETKALLNNSPSTSVSEYKKVLQNINRRLSVIDPLMEMKINVVIEDKKFCLTDKGIDDSDVIDALIEDYIQ